ncbi:phage tail protein [Vibrio nomapromontoriensis]|uniref:phage tail protein n=1 Tax=Vibrio nomapromontoriensis TaxID=2910246 RepID=UPI003D1534AF
MNDSSSSNGNSYNDGINSNKQTGVSTRVSGTGGETRPTQPNLNPGNIMGSQYQGMPVGSIVAYAGQIRTTNTTEGHQLNLAMFPWLICDGSKVAIASYPELYHALGDLYGKATSAHFSLPDFRGQFLRGVDERTSVEASGSKENRKTVDGVENATVGSFQETALRTHQHHYQKHAQGILVPADPPLGEGLAIVSETKDTVDILDVDAKNVSRFESRPPNVFIHWLIKCRGVQS